MPRWRFWSQRSSVRRLTAGGAQTLLLLAEESHESKGKPSSSSSYQVDCCHLQGHWVCTHGKQKNAWCVLSPPRVDVTCKGSRMWGNSQERTFESPAPLPLLGLVRGVLPLPLKHFWLVRGCYCISLDLSICSIATLVCISGCIRLSKVTLLARTLCCCLAQVLRHALRVRVCLNCIHL